MESNGQGRSPQYERPFSHTGIRKEWRDSFCPPAVVGIVSGLLFTACPSPLCCMATRVGLCLLPISGHSVEGEAAPRKEFLCQWEQDALQLSALTSRPSLSCGTVQLYVNGSTETNVHSLKMMQHVEKGRSHRTDSLSQSPTQPS